MLQPELATPHTVPGMSSGRPPSLIHRAAREFAATPTPIIVASLLVNLMALALPLTLQQIYDRILPNAAIDTLAALLIGLLTVVLCDVALKILRDSLVTQDAVEKAFQDRVRAFATLLHAAPADIGAHPGRFWLDRMTAVEEIASVKEGAEKTLFVDLPFIGLFLGMIALIGGWIVLVPVMLIALLAIAMVAMTGAQRRLMEERREDDERRYAQIGEWLTGIGTIKALAMETQVYRRFEALLARGVAYSYHAVLRNNRLPMLGLLFSNLMMVAVSTAGAIEVIAGQMSIGTLACCSLLATRVAQPVFRLLAVAAQVKSLALAETRAAAITDLAVSLPPETASRPAATIRLEDVHLAARKGRASLHIPELSIAPGDIIGIAGAPGGGETQLFALIEGALLPDIGKVYVGGMATSSAQPGERRRWLQHVDGRVAIFRGTILENVAMFRGGAHVADAVAAIEALGLDAQINTLPEGYDTRIGDGAQTVLPYGVQQGLMMARALAQRPAVLLVSQIGALLDIETFGRLERALRANPARPTTLLSSQRAGALGAARRVYEIREGWLRPLDAPAAATPAQTAAPADTGGTGLAMPRQEREPSQDRTARQDRAPSQDREPSKDREPSPERES